MLNNTSKWKSLQIDYIFKLLHNIVCILLLSVWASSLPTQVGLTPVTLTLFTTTSVISHLLEFLRVQWTVLVSNELKMLKCKFWIRWQFYARWHQTWQCSVTNFECITTNFTGQGRLTIRVCHVAYKFSLNPDFNVHIFLFCPIISVYCTGKNAIWWIITEAVVQARLRDRVLTASGR